MTPTRGYALREPRALSGAVWNPIAAPNRRRPLFLSVSLSVLLAVTG